MNLKDRFHSSFSPDMMRALQEAAHVGDEKGRRVVLVGGVVRDLILQSSVGDADIMLEDPAEPVVQELARRLNAKVVSHERFFTFAVSLSSGRKIDVVTAREETYAAPARLPDVVPSSIEKDLKRRDFTINAIACWLNKEKFGDTLDPLSGHKDILAQRIRVLHATSFQDDPSRIYRAARFAGRLGFQVEAQTQKWITQAIASDFPGLLSPVRKRHEFELILREKSPMPALRLLRRWRALKYLHPAWASVDLVSLHFDPEVNLIDRLVQWFGRWSKESILQMMTDLSFEKEVKHKVLSKLVQSPSTS